MPRKDASSLVHVDVFSGRFLKYYGTWKYEGLGLRFILKLDMILAKSIRIESECVFKTEIFPFLLFFRGTYASSTE